MLHMEDIQKINDLQTNKFSRKLRNIVLNNNITSLEH